MDPSSKVVYLTFDDGPVPEVTPLVLDVLKEYGACATFFMVGANVKRYPELAARVLAEGNAVGNHTFHHLPGLKTSVAEYLRDVSQTEDLLQQLERQQSELKNSIGEDVDSSVGLTKTAERHVFRPPYGRMKTAQKREINNAGCCICLWDLLTHDYNPAYTPERMLNIVKKYTRNGSIINFHDSLKSKNNMLQVLPMVIQWLKDEGYEFGLLRNMKTSAARHNKP